jgi:hypothetical protein
MLASTVQFSTYNQTPATHHRQTHTHPQAVQRYDNRPALQDNAHPPQEAARSLRTQQRAYEPDLHLPPTFHTRKRAVLAATDEAGRTGQRSTLEHHPRNNAAPRNRETITSWARLWTTRTNLAASAP